MYILLWIFPLKVKRSRRLTGQSGAGRQQKAEGRATGLWRLWRRSTPRWRHASEPRGAKWKVLLFVIATQFGTQCRLLFALNTQQRRLLLSLTTHLFFHWTSAVSSASFIEHTSMPLAVVFIEHNTVMCFTPLNSYNSAVWFVFRWTLTFVSLLVWLAYLYNLYIFYFDFYFPSRWNVSDDWQASGAEH